MLVPTVDAPSTALAPTTQPQRTMLVKSFIALAACTCFALAAPYPHDSTSLVLPRQANSTTCPGYTATNVGVTDSGLTADLILAGTACNAYTEDIQELKLVVEHQTGTYYSFQETHI